MLPEYMLTYPTVFAVGDKTYYDHCNGILRSNTNMHRLKKKVTKENFPQDRTCGHITRNNVHRSR